MANWTVPSVKASGWSPKGRFGRSVGRGIQQFGQGAQKWASQMLAIKQYEAEQEEKRLQRQREAAMAQVDAMAKEQAQQRALQVQEMFVTRAEDFKKAEAAANREHDIKMAWIKLKGGEDKQKDMEALVDKEFTNLDKLQTDVGKRFGKMLRDARMSGDVGKVKQVYDNVLRNQEHMRTYTTQTTTKDGQPQTVEQPANDANILLGVTQRTLPMLTQLYGQPQKGQYAYPLDQREELKKQLIEIQAMDDDAAARAIQQLIQGGVDPTLLDRLIDEINQ